MKKHNIVKVVLITLLVFMLLTWILPAAYYSGDFIDQGRLQMGLFDLFNYPVTALSYFGYIAFYVMMVGGFYGILHKIPAYRTFLDKMVARFKGKENLVLTLMMVVLAVITSVCGVQLGLFLFFPMLVSIILLMGYNKMVAALTLVGSTVVGLAGTTYAYGNTSVILSILGLEITYETLSKVIILVLGLVLLVVNVMLYIKKHATEKIVKKESRKEEIVKEEVKPVVKKTTVKKTAKKPEVKKTTKTTKPTAAKSVKTTKKTAKKTTKAFAKLDKVLVVKEKKNPVDTEFVPEVQAGVHKIWPFVVSICLMAVVLVLAFMPWSNGFGSQAFDNATTAVTEFELFGFPLFGKLLGTVNAFGSWTLIDMLAVMFVVVVFLTLVYKIKLDDIFDGFTVGVKKSLPVALLVVLIYTCLVITTYHPFQLVIYKFILGSVTKMNYGTALLSTIAAFLAGVFNVEPLYAFQSVLPYLSGLLADTAAFPTVGVIFQSVYGLAMLVAPTSVVLMAVLSYLGVSYKEWLKTVWKLLVEFLVVLLIVFAILVLL